MEKFVKIYLPILSILFVFSGFWYLKSYFGYFGMREVTAELGFDYIAQLSFAVLYNLILFDNVTHSFWFYGAIVVFPLLVFGLPDFNWMPKYNLPRKILGWYGTDQIPLFPFSARLLLVFLSATFSLFRLSDQQGFNHACDLAQGDVPILSKANPIGFRESKYKDLLSNRISEMYSSLDAASGEARNNDSSDHGFYEIWRSKDLVYFTTTVRKCNDPRVTLKIAADVIVITLLPTIYKMESDDE